MGTSFLLLIEEKKAKEDQGLYRGRGSWPGTGCVRNVTGQTSPAAAAALPLMEEKKAKEDQGLYRGRGSGPGMG